MSSATLNVVGVEREELHWILSSGVLGRSNNLARMLTYICEKQFEGHPEEITEYLVAVEALGRRPDFDPHTDTIVRVTTHLLRKRLQEVYDREGSSRPVRIVIPAGKYVPSFVANESWVSPAAGEAEQFPAEEEVAEGFQEERAEADGVGEVEAPADTVGVAEPSSRRRWWIYMLLVAGLVVAAAVWMAVKALTRGYRGMDSVAALPAAKDVTRELMGAGVRRYVAHDGNVWQTGRNCSGGTSVSVPAQKLAGTVDPGVFQSGVRGMAHCAFAAEPGPHEVHLYFAETTELEPVRRKAMVSINAGPDVGVDVVDSAGGSGVALMKVWTGVQPQSDGLIHIDYTSEVSPLNAVEILPAQSDKLLPVRIVAGEARLVDEAGQVWETDRYFTGGRPGMVQHPGQRKDVGVFTYDRVGQVRYAIPVVAGAKYSVRLYFRDPWFGAENGNGGVGSRVFNVYCNGVQVLKNFDILAQAGGNRVVERFDHVEGTADGEIRVELQNVVNHPVINAIEVVPED